MILYFTGRNIEFLIWEKSLLGAPPIQVNYNVLVIISFPENMTVMDVQHLSNEFARKPKSAFVLARITQDVGGTAYFTNAAVWWQWNAPPAALLLRGVG